VNKQDNESEAHEYLWRQKNQLVG